MDIQKSPARPKTIFSLFLRIILAGTILSSLNTSAFAINPGGVVFTSSNLAIVVIKTNGISIPTNTRIICSMGIINNGSGLINNVTDTYNDYNGRIAIQIHGHSSAGFDQKSYRIETQDSAGNNNNVHILGMPKDNDWILYGPYCDKSLIRNALVYSIAGEINGYAPRTRFCELVLNNSYQGVYLMIEKIKQGKNRVNIAEMLPTDINLPEISGGYIFTRELGIDQGDNAITLSSGLKLSIVEPKPQEILPAQTAWLKTYLNTFESALYKNAGDYTTYLDVQSLVDNFLIVEFCKNVDGFRASTFFHKDRNGKIVAGPVWDYNLSLGNADYDYGWTPERWYYQDDGAWFYWFDELLLRAVFWDKIKARWAELRQNIIEYNHMNTLIDNMVSELDQAQVRNFQRWTILGRYTWPNPGYPESGEWGYPSPTSGAPTTWTGEIDYLKDFIRNRLVWMDEQLDYNPNSVNPQGIKTSEPVSVYPNPCSAETKVMYTLSQPAQVQLTVYNSKGQAVQVLQNEYRNTGEYYNTIDTRDLPDGVYIVNLRTGDQVKSVKLIVQK